MSMFSKKEENRLKKHHERYHNNHNKLDEKKVAEIKKRLNWGIPIIKEIARDYGVSPQTISSIKSGRTWSHVMV